MSEKLEIKLGYFEHPSIFYFFFLRDKPHGKRHVKQIGLAIGQQHTSTKNSSSQFVPSVNSIVGYFHMKWLAWIRVKIISKESNGTLRLFLMDYGYYMFAGGRDSEFTEIPENLKGESVLIKRGSLGLRPCEEVQDRTTGELITTPVRYWDSKAIEFVKSFNNKYESAEFHFVPYSRHSDGTHIGDVIVKTMQETISIGEKLIAMKLAMREEGIVAQPVAQMKEAQPAANFEKIFNNFYPEAKEKLIFKPSKPPICLPAGVSLGTYTSQKQVLPKSQLAQHVPPKLQLPQPVPPKPQPSQQAPPKQQQQQQQKKQLPTEAMIHQRPTFVAPSPAIRNPSPPSAAFPSELLAYGQRLRSPVQSIEAVPFIELVKKGLRNNSTPMTKLQAHSWAQIYHGSSMVIVGRTKNDATLAYVPAIVNAMETNRNQVTGIGPVVVVITKLSTDVKMISKMCTRISPELKVVEVFGVDDKKMELLNGCDLLVATPAGFGRLVEGVSIKLFDKERVQIVIFDGIDTMMQSCKSEINAVVRTCTHGRSQTESNPQIIVTSCEWMKEIETILMSCMHPSNMVICIENFIEAAACVGCTVAMEISPNLESKISKLQDSLKSGVFKSNRTIVVANDAEGAKMLTKEFNKASLQVTSADEENHEASKMSWLQQPKGGFSILVTCDSVLKKMELRNAQHLIHFSVPKSWQLLSQRFAALLDQFYSRLEKKSDKTALSTRIFLDDESNLEFAQLVNFLKTRRLANVPDVFINSVKQITEQQELMKCQEKVAMCSNIWKLGECKKYSCPQRHIICEDDKPLKHLPTQTKIKFDLISVKYSTGFVIKIQSHLSGRKWISWTEKNHYDEKILRKDLQEFYEKLENRKPAVVKVGEVYAVMSDKKWQRCKVIEKDSVAYVYLIDVGTVIRSIITKIIELPNAFKNIDPLVYNLQVINLVPFDDEESLSKEVITEMINGIADGCTFTCKVQMAIQDILFTDSFDAQDENGAVRFRMKSKMLKMNICTIDESVGEKLRHFVNDGNIFPQEVRETEDETENETEIDNRQAKEVSKLDDAQFMLESWKHLSLKSSYRAHVKHFKNPESFFVVLDTTENIVYKTAIKEIENCATKVPLKTVKVGSVCAVNGEKIRRGKVMKTSDDDVEILLVDFGEIISCQRSELLELPVDLVTKIPFQTVHCRLTGVRPKFNMKTWPPKQTDAIRRLVRNSSQPLKMHVIKLSEKKNEFDLMGLRYYDVILIDPKSRERLNVVAVAKLFAEPLVDSGHVSDDNTDSDDGAAQAVEKKDNEEDDLVLLEKLIESTLFGGQDELEYEQSENLSSPESYEQAAIMPISDVTEPSITTSSLAYISKHPKIEWHQNETIIYLRISAVDCKEYSLAISDSTLNVIIKYDGEVQEKTVLELYSRVNPKLVSHELRGLNIVVRLVKIPCVEWPRLTETDDRSKFIKYNTENISVDFEEKRLKPLPPASQIQPNDDDSDKESLKLSDDDEFQF